MEIVKHAGDTHLHVCVGPPYLHKSILFYALDLLDKVVGWTDHRACYRSTETKELCRQFTTSQNNQLNLDFKYVPCLKIYIYPPTPQ